MAKKAAAKTGSKKSGPKRRMITTGLVLLILYIGAQVISRTEGIRALVADKISSGTGLPVSLEKCGATPLLGLRLTRLAMQGAEMPDVKLSFDWLSFISKDRPFVKTLRVQDAEVRFRRLPATGNWEPLVLNGVASRLGAVVGLSPGGMKADDSLPVFPPYAINEKTRLQLRRAKIVWQDEPGRELASINGGNLGIKVGRFIDRKVVQSIVECDRIKLATGRELSDFRLESFRVEGSAWVTVLEMSDSHGQYPEFASSTLWQDLNLQLNKLSAVR